METYQFEVGQTLYANEKSLYITGTPIEIRSRYMNGGYCYYEDTKGVIHRQIDLTNERVWPVHVEWTMVGIAKVRAVTLEEAIEKVEEPEFPLPDGDYLEDSFQVNEQFTREAGPGSESLLPHFLNLIRGTGKGRKEQTK